LPVVTIRYVPISSEHIRHDAPVTRSSSADTIVLVSPRRKWIKIVTGCAAFTGVGVLAVARGDTVGWVVIAIFGPAMAFGSALVIRPSRLTVDDRGLTSSQFWRSDRFEFCDCSDFTSWSNPTARTPGLVVFDWSGLGTKRLGGWNKRMSGRNASLPDTYGMTAESLAMMLNERRDTTSHPSG
jgi:hypothetical protein